jgi:hypothetical protein
MALRIDDIDVAFELLEWIRSFELIGLALDRMACPSFGRFGCGCFGAIHNNSPNEAIVRGSMVVDGRSFFIHTPDLGPWGLYKLLNYHLIVSRGKDSIIYQQVSTCINTEGLY